VRRLHKRLVVYRHRQLEAHPGGSDAPAAEHLRADDPAADGDLHARQCLGGAVRAALRQLAAAACRPSNCFAAALTMALWAGSAPLSVWLLFVPIGLAEIGDGISGPAVMAAALSIHPRLAGTASGLMGFLQMAAAALGSFVVALLPYRNAFGMIALYGGFVALGLAAAVFAVRCTQPPPAATAEERPVSPGAPASVMPAAKFHGAMRG
jgi:MFS family permease